MSVVHHRHHWYRMLIAFVSWKQAYDFCLTKLKCRFRQFARGKLAATAKWFKTWTQAFCSHIYSSKLTSIAISFSYSSCHFSSLCSKRTLLMNAFLRICDSFQVFTYMIPPSIQVKRLQRKGNQLFLKRGLDIWKRKTCVRATYRRIAIKTTKYVIKFVFYFLDDVFQVLLSFQY